MPISSRLISNLSHSIPIKVPTRAPSWSELRTFIGPNTLIQLLKTTFIHSSGVLFCNLKESLYRMQSSRRTTYVRSKRKNKSVATFSLKWTEILILMCGDESVRAYCPQDLHNFGTFPAKMTTSFGMPEYRSIFCKSCAEACQNFTWIPIRSFNFSFSDKFGSLSCVSTSLRSKFGGMVVGRSCCNCGGLYGTIAVDSGGVSELEGVSFGCGIVSSSVNVGGSSIGTSDCGVIGAGICGVVGAVAEEDEEG